MTATESSFLRLFVAMAVPDVVRIEMVRAQDDLRSSAAAEDVRWVGSSQLHLTLKFLGAVPADALDDVKAALSGACAGIGPFRLRAQGIGFFPSVRSPRVIWIGFEHEPAVLRELQQRIGRALASFGEKADEDKFKAHVTIGRFQKFRRHKTEKLMSRASSFAETVFGEWQVEAVELMRSELSAQGARHTTLASVSLV